MNLLLERLVPLVNTERSILKALKENAAITISRLGLACVEDVSPHLHYFLDQWCALLGPIRDNSEKESAFLGMCVMLKQNPNGIGNSLARFCEAVSRFNKPSASLNSELESVLKGYKAMAGDKWNAFYGALPPFVRQRLTERYSL